jgi:hypothetical protein
LSSGKLNVYSELWFGLCHCPWCCTQGLQDAGVAPVLSWEDFLFVGKTRPRQPKPPKAGDTSTIMYTSGTTGAGL